VESTGDDHSNPGIEVLLVKSNGDGILYQISLIYPYTSLFYVFELFRKVSEIISGFYKHHK